MVREAPVEILGSDERLRFWSDERLRNERLWRREASQTAAASPLRHSHFAALYFTDILVGVLIIAEIRITTKEF